MAREILFRGKRCDNGEWVQGYYIRADHHWHKHGIHKDWIALGASANGGWFALHNKYAVKAETVGQFTGLTDKNGKRIFEGDIAKCTNKDGTSVFYEVVWDNEFAALMFRFIGGWSGVFMAGMNERVEVIGNIHDNPELLNDKES